MSQKLSFLIADDESGLLITLRKLIGKAFPSAEIYTANDGVEAFDIIEKKHPAIVLSDLSMPNMDGMQLLIKTRSIDIYKDIFFIIVTAHTDFQSRVQALEKGADDFLTKPISSDFLQARLKSAMRIVNLQNQFKEENQLLVELAEELEKYIQDVTKLSVRFMEARIPASYEVLKKVADAATWIAKQFKDFDEHELRDIEIASYLSQSGRIFLPDKLLNQPVLIDGVPSDPLMYQVPVAARDIVSGVRRFSFVSEVLYHIYENFDGSGFPGRLKSWQIPIGSRIIRAVLDFYELKKTSKESSAHVLEKIRANANKFYDHRVVVYLEQFVLSIDKDAADPNEKALLLSDLADGMVLARDIITQNGLKLVPAGATLREQSIQKIISHNTSDPILGHIYVKNS